MNNRLSFIDFVQGLLNMNPIERWSPQQARLHPFITGEKWTKPWTVSAGHCFVIMPFLNDDHSLLEHHPPTERLLELPRRVLTLLSIRSVHTEAWSLRNQRALARTRMPPHTTSTLPSTKRTRHRHKRHPRQHRMCTGTPTCSRRLHNHNRRRTTPSRTPPTRISHHRSNSLRLRPSRRRIVV